MIQSVNLFASFKTWAVQIHIKCVELVTQHHTMLRILPTTLWREEFIGNSDGSHYHKFRMSTLHPITLLVPAAVANRI